MTSDPNDPPLTRRELRRRERMREAELAAAAQLDDILTSRPAAPADEQNAPGPEGQSPVSEHPARQSAASEYPAGKSPVSEHPAGQPLVVPESGGPPEQPREQHSGDAVSSPAAPSESPARTETAGPGRSLASADADQREPEPEPTTATGQPEPAAAEPGERALTRRERRAMLQAQQANQFVRDSRSHDEQDSSDSGSSSAPNSLILPTVPPDVTGPLGRGEVVVTGSIELPHSLSTTGTHHRIHDAPEIDSWLSTDGEQTQSVDSMAPVPASRAVSSRSSSDPVLPAQKGSSGRVPAILAGVAAVLAAGVAGVIVTGYVMGLL